MTRTIGNSSNIETERVDVALEQAAGVLAVAGHQVSDPYVENLIDLAARGEISIEDMTAEIQRYLA